MSDSAEQLVLFERDGDVAVLTMNRPKSFNAMNLELMTHLANAAERARDERVRAIVVTGAGRAFSAGGDLSAFADAPDAPALLRAMTDELHRAQLLLAEGDAPVVAAVNGMAAGAGLSLACMCDLVVAARSAKFTMAYTGAGLSPDGSSSYFVPRLIGMRRTQELMLTNRVLSAEEALEWQLINRVVDDDAALTDAKGLAQQLAAGPTRAHGAVKRLLLATSSRELEVQLDLEGKLIAQMSGTADGQEGISAFLEKRKPSSAESEVAALSPYKKKRAQVKGLEMAYVEEGQGDPVLFLHGNPTSSYLWRNVIPHLRDKARCIAPDLVGMGDSDKLPEPGPDRYRFVEHREYLDALLEQLDLGDRVTLVIHDWGSALGFDWAQRHRDRVRGIAYMEAIVAPIPGWEQWPESARGIFQGLRSDAGEEMILEKNLFIEAVLPSSILRPLEKAEHDEYRRPFLEAGESRRPTLTWPRQIPIAGEPADVSEIAGAYAKWLAQSDVPKLFINAEPGAILTGELRELCRRWPKQREVTVKGSHFIQEDSPDEIGSALSDWFDTLV